MIKDPLRMLPLFVGSFLEFLVSMKRIQQFMLVDEVNTTIVRSLNREETPNSIEIRQGSNFHWGVKKEEKNEEAKKEGKTETQPLSKVDEENTERKTLDDLLVLKDLSLSIKQGEFVCIVGDVGAGKSSLLMSIVGDLLYASPEFAGRFRNNTDWTLSELKDALLKHSLRPILTQDAPILISEQMALVQ